MRTVIETPEFQHQASKIWTDAQRDAFIEWIAAHPTMGDVIPGASGARKIRWAASGRGKRGGARVIYFHLSEQGVVVLIAVYVKAERDNMTAQQINKVNHGH